MKMIVSFIIVVFFSTSYSAESSITLITNRKISDSLLVKIVNSPEIIDLNSIDPSVEKELLLKIYKLPIQGSCIPETETTCAYDCYLAVSEYDENPAQTVYYLGTIGEISGYRWIKTSNPNTAFLELTVINYPEFVIKQNKELKKISRKYILDITVDSIKIKAHREFVWVISTYCV